MKLNKKISHSDKVFILIALVLCSMPILLQMGIINASSTVLYIGKCMAFAIVAIAIDLIWGYTGILSLGHGLYFSLGGYAMAMYLKLVSTEGAITDFMRVGGLSELPLIWKPFQFALPSFILVFAVPAFAAWIIGYFIFKNRVKGVYFSIISQALTWAAYSLFIALSPYTNGNTGITEIRSIFGNIKGDANFNNMIKLYYLTVALLVITYFIARIITKTKLGKLLVAIRDGENRTYFSGYKVSSFKNFIYIVSAAMAGMAGAIFVNFNGSITPSQMTIQYSIMMVIWVAVGGRGTILGAVIGAFLINLCEYNLSSGSMVQIWQYIIGGGFTIVIIFFKGGVVGVVSDFFERAKAKKNKAKTKESEANLCQN
ncbi:MAG: urea ABC transporter permease subunit UrtC [Clostridia bacterium]